MAPFIALSRLAGPLATCTTLAGEVKHVQVQACPMEKWLKGGVDTLKETSSQELITQDSPGSWATVVPVCRKAETERSIAMDLSPATVV